MADPLVPAPSVDVVIPTYNRLDMLPTAIASVLGQTHKVRRIIVADDGSGDGSPQWLRLEAMREPVLQVIELDHGGGNRARNAGIAAARAQWVAFLDSDDAWEPDKLERQFALLRQRPDCVGLFTGFRLVGGAVERLHIPRDDPSLHDLRCSNVLGSTSSAVVRRDVLEEIGGFNPALPSCQDWDLWFRLRQRGRLGVVRAPLVRFNNGPHDRITKAADKVLEGHRAIFRQLLDGVSGRSQQARICAMHRLVEADIERRFGRPGAALGLAVRSFVEHPSKSALAAAWRVVRGGVRAA